MYRSTRVLHFTKRGHLLLKSRVADRWKTEGKTVDARQYMMCYPPPPPPPACSEYTYVVMDTHAGCHRDKRLFPHLVELT